MEIWDAYTAEGEKLEFDLIRGEEIPQGAYHLMAEIYTVAEDGALLLTQRHPEKLWPLKWEITGGSLPQCQVMNSIKVKIKEQHNVILYFLSFLTR